MKKQFYQKLSSLVLMLLVSGLSFAQQFVVDGIKYNVLTGTTNVEVISNSPQYSGVVNIPSTVTNASVTYSVTSISRYAFAYCSGLTSVTIPSSITKIEDWSFAGCSALTSVSIPNSVTSIGDSTFFNCTALKNTTIPNSVNNIGNGVFDGCSSLTNMIIPNSLTSTGNHTFASCTGLTSITIPNSVTSIGYFAFESSGLTSVTIPNSVTTIDYYAFYSCTGLTSITIPNSVISIDMGAFRNCSGLTSVTIPNSVTNIGDQAFIGCTALTSITLEANSPITITSSVFERVANTNEIFSASIYTTATLYVPAGSKTAYQNDAVWGKFTNIVESPITGIENINASNFSIFPNPATDNVTVTLAESVLGTVSIVDLKGNILMTKSISGNTSNISTAEFASGVYVVKINSDKGVAVKQLVVE